MLFTFPVDVVLELRGVAAGVDGLFRIYSVNVVVSVISWWGKDVVQVCRLFSVWLVSWFPIAL